ncbi:MAG TPA: amidophosphoribosyltransferase, partial [Bdellovibrionales bacterium]|nr:amidophosphoribosyltransferase [Bdellovibrionales bacterium]
MKTWREECGVFAIWNNPEASRLTYLGLYALQHRGQESAGIVSLNDGTHLHHKGQGLVADVFTETDLDRLKGFAAVGHNRYSTTGENLLTNAQPLTAQLKDGPVAVAHNGNIVNAGELRERLKKEGAIFQGSNDTECLLHLLARHNGVDFMAGLQASVKNLVGAFSFCILTHDKLIAIRDPYGFRPLVMGRIGNSVVFASETCAFDLIGATFVREIEPGEMFWIDKNGEHSVKYADKKISEHARCIFEYVYFSRPDSVVFNHSVYEVRKQMGRWLARETKVDADIVIPVPDSGVPASIGYAAESGIPLELGIIRNHYVGRTFIEPRSAIRSFGVKVKLNPQSAVLAGKRVVVIDDSIVRGTTSRKIIGLIRQAGAKEIHLRIAAPPTVGPCYYGVDTPTRGELIASHMSVPEIQKFVEADSLSYLSLEGLYHAVGESQGFCSACFDNKYPTPLFGAD